jgi:hypothetical protein
MPANRTSAMIACESEKGSGDICAKSKDGDQDCNVFLLFQPNVFPCGSTFIPPERMLKRSF